jgi:hypothetical protein
MNRLAIFPSNLARVGAAMGTIGGVTLFPGVYKFTIVFLINISDSESCKRF